MNIRPKTLITAGVLLVAIASCGGDDSGSKSSDDQPAGVTLEGKKLTDSTGKKSVQVNAVDNSFTPQYLTVSAGTVVTFRNDGHNEHNLIPANDGAFTPALQADFQPKTDVKITFAKPGDYPYYCSLHGTTTVGMIGGIRVVK